MKRIRTIFSKIIMCAVAAIFACTAAIAATNIPAGDVDEFGTWATPHNRTVLIDQISQDLNQFHDNRIQLVKDYVPIEAKVGLAFIAGLNQAGKILDSSLMRFAIIFIIIAYVFWVLFEAYNLIIGKAKIQDTVMALVKKTVKIAIWIIVLNYGAAQVFMWAMGPIITIGTTISDIILNSIASTAGAMLPDTCTAIREYVAQNIPGDMIIDAKAAADIMCVPTRMSTFFATGLAAGWAWMVTGIGYSAFSFLAGAVMVIIFTISIWKFALMAFGVISDLFLAVLMLPFTAISETVSNTSYKGIAADVYNGFLGLFSSQSLSTQIERFIKAALYFISLSIVVGLAAGILSGVIDADLASQVPSLQNDGFMVTMLSIALVGYLLNRSSEIAGKIGGSIDASLGDELGKSITRLYNNAYSKLASLVKTIRQDGKQS